MNQFNLINYMTAGREQGILIWLCNIGAEKYWNTVNPGVVDRQEEVVVNRIEEMNLLLCRKQDYIILREKPDPDYLETLQTLGFAVPNILVPSSRDPLTPISELVLRDESLLQTLQQIARKQDDVYFVPYAVTYLEESIALQCNLKICGASSRLNALINDKIYNRQIAEKLGFPVCQGRVCRTVEEIRAEYEHLVKREPFFDKVIIKEPFGASGKGLYLIEDPEKLEPRLRLIARSARNNPEGQWLVEGWYPTKADLNYQVYIGPDGAVNVFSIKQQLLRDSVYLGSKAPSDLNAGMITSIEDYGRQIGEYLFGLGYTGVAGIDAIIIDGDAHDDLLIPIIEINGRFTLSTYISFLNSILGKVKILSRYFRLITRTPISYREMVQLLKREGIAYTAEKKEGVIVYTSGTLPRSITEDGGVYPGRLFVLLVAGDWNRIESLNAGLERMTQQILAQ